MSLVEDVRRLTEAPEPCSGDRRWFCGAWSDAEHKPDCPWLALPRLVAVVEAAERIAEFSDGDGPYKYWGPDGDPVCAFCEDDPDQHAPDCPWQALVAALRGEVQPL